jgi:O-succinylbenzoic acid--CoA ligase
MLAREQIHQALAGTGPTVLISSTAKFDPEGENFKSLLNEQSQNVEPIAILIETSGSSGTPKLVALSAQAVSASAEITNKFLGAEIGDRWSLTLPLNHIAGINQLTRSINLETTPAQSDGEGAQFISVVPTQLHRAIQNRDSLFNNLLAAKKVLVGGAPISEKLIDDSLQFGIPIVTSYGMTEMSGGCIYNSLPLPGVEVRIDINGLINLKGPMIASSYFDDKELTQKHFQEGWFITSDLGELENDKLKIIGRSDDLIISGGEKISAIKVEALIRSHYPDLEFTVIGIPDIEWGQALRVVVTGDNQGLTLAQIRDIVGVQIGRFAAPRSLLYLEQMPMIGIGKPDLVLLKSAQATEEI